MKCTLSGWAMLLATAFLTSCTTFTQAPRSHPLPMRALPEHTEAAYFYQKGKWYQYSMTLESSDRVVSGRKRDRTIKTLRVAPTVFVFNNDTKDYDIPVSPGSSGVWRSIPFVVQGRDRDVKMSSGSGSPQGGGSPYWPYGNGTSLEILLDPTAHGSNGALVKDKTFTATAKAMIRPTDRERKQGVSDVVLKVDRTWKVTLTPEEVIELTEIDPLADA